MVLLNLHHALPAALLVTAASCMNINGRKGYGLIGYGIDMYKPNCAFSCRAAISSCVLDCSTEMEEGHDMHNMKRSMDMPMMETSADCYATDDAFLTTMAYCIQSRCEGLADWELEKYWRDNIPGTSQVQPFPKWTYQQTLAKIQSAPNETAIYGEALNQTMLVSQASWLASWNAQDVFEEAEGKHEKYSIIVVVTCFVLPIALSFLRFVPFPSALVTRFHAWFIDPPLWGTKQKQPLAGGLGLMPTRGQALFIAYILAINLILSCVGYRSAQPNAWNPTARDEITVLVANRVGVLSFANLPLLILYSSRNNLLLLLTDWGHATFLLLHRWVAGIATIQAVLHSLIYLRLRIVAHTHTEESQMPYWIWGIVGTLTMCVMLPASVLYIRHRAYEIFLVAHIVLSIFAIVGCYYHILLRFAHQWGYEVWLYAAMAVWGFDRVMRMLRLARNGIRTAVVTNIDDDYMRVDVPGVVATGHAYLYFPTLTWRVWENHPFSVASAVLPQRTLADEEARSPTSFEKDAIQISTTPASTTSVSSHSATPMPKPAAKLGLTFFLRRQGGLTASLAAHASLPVLVEASYGSHHSTSHAAHLVAIAGGIGITAALPYLRSHAGSSRLFWGVRSKGISQSVEQAGLLSGIEKEVFIGDRMDVGKVVRDECERAGKGSVLVVCCGPAGMADEVRAVVGAEGRRGVDVRLVDEGFSW